MKVLLIHRYFWPDTPPYALMLRRIAKQLADDGHDVTVFSTQPSYKDDYAVERQPWSEQIDSFHIIRQRLLKESKKKILARIANMAIFCLAVFFHILKNHYDIVMISTVPPIIGAVAVRFAALLSGSAYIYHCMDLHPEIMAHAGHLRQGVFFRFLLRLDRKNCEKALATVVLSEDMRTTLLGRGYRSPENIHVINNFELRDYTSAEQRQGEVVSGLLKEPGRFRVIFAGNIGRFQGLEHVIDAAEQLKSYQEIEFVFLGEGGALKQLQEKAADLNGKSVFFRGHQTVNVARKVIADADIALISLNAGIVRLAFPSKTMTYLCEGVPVLVVVEDDSELAQMVRSAELGYVVRPGDSDHLASTILSAYQNRQQLYEKRKAIANFATACFGVESVLTKWSQLFQKAFAGGHHV